MARVYLRQTRAGQSGPLALISMHQGRSHWRGGGTRAIMNDARPRRADSGPAGGRALSARDINPKGPLKLARAAATLRWVAMAARISEPGPSALAGSALKL